MLKCQDLYCKMIGKIRGNVFARPTYRAECHLTFHDKYYVPQYDCYITLNGITLNSFKDCLNLVCISH